MLVNDNKDDIIEINDGKNLLVTCSNELNDFNYIVAKLLSTNQTEDTLKLAIEELNISYDEAIKEIKSNPQQFKFAGLVPVNKKLLKTVIISSVLAII